MQLTRSFLCSFLAALALLWWPEAARADEQRRSPPPSNVPVSGPEEDQPKEPVHEHVEVLVTEEKPASEAASRLHVGRRELELRPKRRAADVLEATPGLFVAQHAGGGKANQYFLRGFDADHGTDVAFFLDGVPVNLVSHGHGQGYTDLNLLIPELVVGLDVYKGPYYAQFGDFATGGALNLQLAETFPENFASVSAGQYDTLRGLVIAAPALGEGWRSVLAGEVYATNGPFENPEKLRRFNLFARTTRDLAPGSKLALTWMSYGSAWNGNGQIPARAVCGEGETGLPAPEQFGAECIDRFDSIDPTEGGHTQRHMLSGAYSLSADDADFSALLYAVRYRWNLHSNFTFFANDPIDGDGIEQTDDRSVYGGDLRVRRHVHFGPSRFTTTFGAQVRADSIDNALRDQTARERTSTRVEAGIQESQIGVYLEEDARLLPELRFILGARLQRIDVAVEDRLEDRDSLSGATSGTQGSTLFLPKLSAILTPLPGWHLFGHVGRGFHSNDARGAVLANGRVDLMTPALGYEIGTRFEPLPDLSVYAAGFLLDLDSEQVWVGDEGKSEASSATRRMGIELGARGRLSNWLFADIDLTFTRARYRHTDDSVALAPTRTLTAGVSARPTFDDYTPFGSVRFKAIADRPATEDGSLTARGFALLDASAGLRWKNVEGALDIQNVLDSAWREVNFATTSRLQHEPEPVTGIHYAPGWPRTVTARATLYWP
ncbi:MAG TPA: TonB-dependent receptor [Polyangiaceae bacterium]